MLDAREKADRIAQIKRDRLYAMETAIRTRRRWVRALMRSIVRFYNWLEHQVRAS